MRAIGQISGLSSHFLAFLCAFRALILVMMITVWGAAYSGAQVSPPSDRLAVNGAAVNAVSPLPADLTEERLAARIESLRSNVDLTDEAKAPIIDDLTAARDRLIEAREQDALAAQYRAIINGVEESLEDLRARRDAAESLLEEPLPDLDAEEVTGISLMRMEQELSSRDASATTLENNLSNLQKRLSDLATRADEIRTSRNANRLALETLNSQISALGPDESAAADATRKRLLARRHFREYERLALSAEAPSLLPQISITEEQIALTQAELAQENRYIERLQDRTGQRRAEAAAARLTAAQATLSELTQDNTHPLVIALAKENAAYAQQIVDIFNTGNATSVTEARIGSLLQKVEQDALLADQILKEDNVDRKYAAILRQLRADIPSVDGIRTEIDNRAQSRLDISFQRLLAQDRLNSFRPGRLDVSAAFSQFFTDNPAAPPLTEEQSLQVRGLYTAQRGLLEDVVDFADAKTTDMAKLNTQQQRLLTSVDELQLLLDKRLIWMPSTEAVSLDWPRRIGVGAITVFTPSNIMGALRDFSASLPRHILLTLLTLIAILLSLWGRPRLTEQLKQMSASIGRVKDDTLLVTPLAVLASVIRVAPLCVLAAWAGYILVDSNGAEFSIKLGRSILIIALIYIVLLSIRAWSRDGGLFDLHFGMRRVLRDRISKNLLWFAAAQSIAALLMTLCEGYDNDDISAGLGLLGFIIGTATLVVLIYRLLWEGRSVTTHIFPQSTFVGRRRREIMVVLALLPLGTALLALTGYFDTALEIQTRILLTMTLMIASYIVYGVIRRTVEISQRRLALEEAKKRRAKLLQERKERAEAEERGEVPTPKLDYESIDLETISRQSTQLLNIVAGIVLAVVAYVLWADLLPALSNLDQTKLPFNTSYTGDDGQMITEPASLWDLLQAIFGIAITVLAAKNLPGFLDLFVLKRANISAGSRYAITTILGYTIFMIGFLFVSRQLGIDWSKLSLIIAALSLGIGFGLQEIIANFISGLIILFERPVRIGDYVTIGDQSGTIARIKIRATTLSDLDNREILIPNKELITGRVTNWTLTNQTSRMTIKVGIAYGSDTDMAREVIMGSVKETKSVLRTPEPQVLFLGFGDSSLDFEVRVFLPTFTGRPAVAHELHTRINKALAEAGISIPFPQRDLHIVSSKIGELGRDQKTAAKAKPKAKSAARPAKPKAEKPSQST